MMKFSKLLQGDKKIRHNVWLCCPMQTTLLRLNLTFYTRLQWTIISYLVSTSAHQGMLTGTVGDFMFPLKPSFKLKF